ncbi:hypothetical protein OHS59_24620 [Streptomyces sp. NBC_00414]|uniref:hypothetical protein n=1 Tax=Streptomyces sp. NBC_00414 TaxID=2975739 RepID=UPI002E1B3903
MFEDKAPEPLWAPPSRPWRPWPRRSARLLWKSPRRKDDPGVPLAEWLTAETVALVGFDRVEAYGTASGEPRWTWQPPGTEVIACAVQAAGDGIGVVLHHDDGDPLSQEIRITTLDLGSGEVVSTRAYAREPLGSIGAYPPEVALGVGRTATIAGRWGATPRFVSLDPRTGDAQWKREVGDRVSEVSVLSAEPFVVSVKDRGQRGGHRLLLIDEHERVTVDLPEPYERFGSQVAVVGGVLAVALVARDQSSTTGVGTGFGVFSVTTGELLWEWRHKRGASAFLLAHRGRLIVLHGYGDRVTVFDPVDGRVVAHRRLRGYGFDARLVAAGDHIAVVCTARADTHRLRVFRWR